MKVCAVVLDGGKVRPNTKRNTYDSFGNLGLEVVLDDLRAAGIAPEYATTQSLHLYDFALWSITAPEDIPVFLQKVASGQIRKGKCQLVVGGAGCVNIASIYDYVDIAVFGRGEGIVPDILAGGNNPSVWRKASDPELEGEYTVRQASKLSPNESTCGCKRKCLYCQYTWVRKRVGDNYSAKLGHGPQHNINEEDFSALSIEVPGRYTTAFDGLSEETRRRVNKGFVTDAMIADKFMSMLDVSAQHGKAVMLKVFNIVGFPWETPETLNKDMEALFRLFRDVCSKRVAGRVMAAIHSTPFSPEPLTPMELMPANVATNWRQVFGGACKAIINEPVLNVFLDPYTNTPPTLAKRVLVNRCSLKDRHKVQRILSGNKLDGQRGSGICASVREYLGRDVFGEQGTRPVPYLSTYIDVSAIGRKILR